MGMGEMNKIKTSIKRDEYRTMLVLPTIWADRTQARFDMEALQTS